MEGLSVKSFYETNRINLKLENLNENADLTKILTNPYTNKPSLPLTGYLKQFPHNRIQILGEVEISYLNDLNKRSEITSKVSTILY